MRKSKPLEAKRGNWPVKQVAGFFGLGATSAAAQNPMNVVNEPDYAPGVMYGGGLLLLLVVGAYAFVLWLLFWGPLRHWANEHTGGAAIVLWGGPIVIVVVAIAVLTAIGITVR